MTLADVRHLTELRDQALAGQPVSLDGPSLVALLEVVLTLAEKATPQFAAREDTLVR